MKKSSTEGEREVYNRDIVYIIIRVLYTLLSANPFFSMTDNQSPSICVHGLYMNYFVVNSFRPNASKP